MNHPAHHKRSRLGVLLLALLLVFSLVPTLAVTASAAETGDGWKENVELTGEFTGTFTFDSNTSEIFRVDNAAPGDIWEGEIKIQNRSGGPMEVALLSIVSNLEDLDLYNALDLDIWIGDDTIYSGKYGETITPISKYYSLRSGKDLILDVRVAFPPECGNEYMGESMDSTWTFDARYVGDSTEPVLYPYTVKYIEEETGEPLADDKHSYGEYGETVIEYALDIDGYTVDKSQKSIVIRAHNNVITFYYTKDKGGDPAPGDTPTKPGENVQTGVDLSGSNTAPVIYFFVIGLCAVAILVTCLRIRAAVRSSKKEQE